MTAFRVILWAAMAVFAFFAFCFAVGVPIKKDVHLFPSSRRQLAADRLQLGESVDFELLGTQIYRTADDCLYRKLYFPPTTVPKYIGLGWWEYDYKGQRLLYSPRMRALTVIGPAEKLDEILNLG